MTDEFIKQVIEMNRKLTNDFGEAREKMRGRDE